MLNLIRKYFYIGRCGICNRWSWHLRLKKWADDAEQDEDGGIQVSWHYELNCDLCYAFEPDYE